MPRSLTWLELGYRCKALVEGRPGSGHVRETYTDDNLTGGWHGARHNVIFVSVGEYIARRWFRAKYADKQAGQILFYACQKLVLVRIWFCDF